jgi:hypothetical protein
MKTVYQARDGSVFPDAQAALEHEQILFKSWLRTNKARVYREFCEALDDPCEDEYYGTPRELALQFLQKYWEELE